MPSMLTVLDLSQLKANLEHKQISRLFGASQHFPAAHEKKQRLGGALAAGKPGAVLILKTEHCLYRC